jgi:hypothetical protein
MDGHIFSVLDLGACGSLQIKKIEVFSNLNILFLSKWITINEPYPARNIPARLLYVLTVCTKKKFTAASSEQDSSVSQAKKLCH